MTSGELHFDSRHSFTEPLLPSYGDSAFFVMDTRRYRSSPHEISESATMLGDKQLAALYNWLGKVCHPNIACVIKTTDVPRR